MDVRFQKTIDRWAGIPACMLLSVFHFLANLFRGPFVPQAPKRILVILLSEIGSLVLAEPMFRSLRERYPNAEIHTMLFARNKQVLDLLGFTRQEHCISLRDESFGNFLMDLWRAALRVRRIQFDVVIDCELFSRISAILCGISAAQTRIGFYRHAQEIFYRGSFINFPVVYNPYRHISHQFVALANAIDSQSNPSNKNIISPKSFDPPLFTPEPGEVDQAVQQLHSNFPALAGKRIVLLYPSGGLLAVRAWPLQHYAQVAMQLIEDGYAIGVIGMQDDAPLANQLLAQCAFNSSCVNLTGYTTTVRDLLLLFHHAKLLITNDGGPGQFAAMTSIPTIVCFCPETPTLYRSWSPHSHAFYTQLPCSPCLSAYNHRTSPCDGDNQCLKRILPADVLKQARSMLA